MNNNLCNTSSSLMLQLSRLFQLSRLMNINHLIYMREVEYVSGILGPFSNGRKPQ